MSAITAASPTNRRPATITASIVILAILALSVLFPLPGAGEIPAVILVLGYTFAALKAVAAVGLWWCKRWAAILGFVVVLLDALAAAPGAVAAPSVALQTFVIVLLLASVTVLVLLVLRSSRHGYA